MIIEETRLIFDLLSKMSGDAVLGVGIYLIIDLLKIVVPWTLGAWVCTKLVDKIPKIIIRKES